MPRRKGRVHTPDPQLEKMCGDIQLVLAGTRAKEAMTLSERNRLWYVMFHKNGYTQRHITELSNQRLDKSDPNYVTEATVEKALLKMR